MPNAAAAGVLPALVLGALALAAPAGAAPAGAAAPGAMTLRALFAERPVRLSGLTRINAIATADFGGDASLDVAALGTSRAGPVQLAVFLNRGADGAERFERTAGVDVGATASGMAAGDLNGDGRTDLVVSRHDDIAYDVLFGQGDGTFRQTVVSPAFASPGRGAPHSHNVVLVDVNGDGNLDIVTAQAEFNLVLAAPGDGAGAFGPFRVLGETGGHPYRITATDLDGDGITDFITPNVDSGDLTVLYGGSSNGAADAADMLARRSRTVPLFNARVSMVVAADLDGDGLQDLLTAGNEGSSFAVLPSADDYRWDDDGGRLRAPVGCQAPKVTDLNMDGHSDVVAVSMSRSALAVWFGRAEGGWEPLRFLDIGGVDPQVCEVADINGDGRPDIAMGGWNSDQVVLLMSESR